VPEHRLIDNASWLCQL